MVLLNRNGLSRGQVEAAIAEASPQLGLVMPLDLRNFESSSTNTALTANAIYLSKFRVSKPTPITNIYVNCAANASGFNGDAGVVGIDGTTYLALETSGSTAIAAAATGILTFTLATPYECQPGEDYWLTFGADSATPTFTQLTATSSAVMGATGLVFSKTATFPIADFTSPNVTGRILMIWAD